MIVNRAQTTAGKITLEDWLELKGIRGIDRHGIVHRLDKDTSGLMVVGKTAIAMQALQAQFKERQVKKSYLALVHGKLEPKKGSINAPISRNPFNRQRFGIFVGGRSATTDYQLESAYLSPEGEELSLVKAFPLTGRTHQIRVHIKSIGHPVVSDLIYAPKKLLKFDFLWCPRLFLHASKIKFSHPKSKKDVEFKSDLPGDLKDALSYLTPLRFAERQLRGASN